MTHDDSIQVGDGSGQGAEPVGLKVTLPLLGFRLIANNAGRIQYEAYTGFKRCAFVTRKQLLGAFTDEQLAALEYGVLLQTHNIMTEYHENDSKRPIPDWTVAAKCKEARNA